MSIDGSILDGLEAVIDEKAARASRGGSSRTSGTVTRVDSDGTVWARLAGASTDTPCRSTTVAVKPGDFVSVEVGGGSARITGNVSAPSTDDETALKAQASADKAIEDAGRARAAAQVAEESAVSALQSASQAATAADNAVTAAGNAVTAAGQANTAANNALTQLSTVENVVGVLNWISEHATYQASTDTSVVPGKFYFTRSGSGTEADPYVYSIVQNPTGNPSANGYYEIDSIDEAVSNYVMSHVALDDDGLWIVNDAISYKALFSPDGLKVFDAGGDLVATFGESIEFSSSRPQTIGGEDAYITFYDSDDDEEPDSIMIGGTKVSINAVVTASGETMSLSDMLTLLGETASAADDAKRTATDYLTFTNGELTIGTSDSDIRSVLSNVKFAFKTDSGDIAYFGLNNDDIWEMHIDNAFVDDMLRFGDYAWIKRQNGNMSIKWLGA